MQSYLHVWNVYGNPDLDVQFHKWRARCQAIKLDEFFYIHMYLWMNTHIYIYIYHCRASHTGDAIRTMYSSVSGCVVHVLFGCAQVQSTV